MKKCIVSVFFVAFCFLLFLTACKNNNTKLSSETGNLLGTVTSNKSAWETYDGKYCIYIQLRQTDGDYFITCGYDDEPLVRTDDTVSHFTPDICVSYDLTESSIGNGYVDRMMSAYDSLNGSGGSKLIGNTAYYCNDSDSDKDSLLESLFSKIDKQ